MTSFFENKASLISPPYPARRRLLVSGLAQAFVCGAGLASYSGASFGQGAPAKDKLQALTPQDFGAAGDGVRDDTAAFKALAAKPGSYIRVPPGRYVIRDTIAILDRQVWQFEGAELIHERGGAMFKAATVNDWAMLGVARFTGVGAVKTSPANMGLLIETCRRFRVSALQFLRFSGAGLVLSGAVPYLTPRGDRGQFSDLGFTDCARAIEIGAAASSEYNIFTNTAVTACGEGIVVGAGNCQFVGGNVVDCRVGVVLLPGPNHGHGGFHGVNLNHASEFNLFADAIDTGFTFNGCHFYGDGGLKGAIFLRNSKGILIQGGQIDCAVINDGKTGKNFLLNNTAPGANFKLVSNTQDQAGIVCRSVLRFDGTDACSA